MKLFKKVLAVVLVGAMAVSMLTACGSSKQTKAVNKVGKGNALVAETNDAMTTLKTATQAANLTDDDVTKYYAALQNGKTSANDDGVKAMEEKLDAARQKIATDLSQFTCSSQNATNAKYDLYIWTNAAENPTTKKHYAYLMRVDYDNHVKGPRLALLVSPSFVDLGEFKGTDSDYSILKDVLKNVEGDVGISVSKVYGKDVLMVAVPKGQRANVSDFGKTN